MKLKFNKNMLPIMYLTTYAFKGKKISLGRHVKKYNIEELVTKLNIAEFEYIRSNGNLSIYRTKDLGYGYRNSFSKSKFLKLININLINKDINIYLNTWFGNISSYILLEDIDSKTLLTENTYVLLLNKKEVLDISIGEFNTFNKLINRKDLDGLTIYPKQLYRSNKIHRIDVRYNRLKDSSDLINIDEDVPF